MLTNFRQWAGISVQIKIYVLDRHQKYMIMYRMNKEGFEVLGLGP